MLYNVDMLYNKLVYLATTADVGASVRPIQPLKHSNFLVKKVTLTVIIQFNSKSIVMHFATETILSALQTDFYLEGSSCKKYRANFLSTI